MRETFLKLENRLTWKWRRSGKMTGARSGRCGGWARKNNSALSTVFTVLSGTMRNLHFVIIDEGSCLVPLTQKADDLEILGWKKRNPNGEFVYRETRSADTFFIISHSEHLCLRELTAISESRRALRVLSCVSAWSFSPYAAFASQSDLHWW